MAEGGRESDTDDESNSGPRRPQRQLGQQEVSDQATVLMRNFIVDRFEQDSVQGAPRMEDLGPPSPEEEDQDEVCRQVGMSVRKIADNFHENQELRRLIDTAPMDIEKIIEVAQVIFGDGKINWGRIIGLFYFAYRMCVRAMDNLPPRNFPAWVNQLIKEIVRFLARRFGDWIINRGGWTAIKEYFGSSTRVFCTLIGLSILTLCYGVHKFNK